MSYLVISVLGLSFLGQFFLNVGCDSNILEGFEDNIRYFDYYEVTSLTPSTRSTQKKRVSPIKFMADDSDNKSGNDKTNEESGGSNTIIIIIAVVVIVLIILVAFAFLIVRRSSNKTDIERIGSNKSLTGLGGQKASDLETICTLNSVTGKREHRSHKKSSDKRPEPKLVTKPAGKQHKNALAKKSPKK